MDKKFQLIHSFKTINILCVIILLHYSSNLGMNTLQSHDAHKADYTGKKTKETQRSPKKS